MSYCSYCKRDDVHEVHKVYHDTQYGFPIDSDNELFEWLVLEINQAGLSWETILKKQEGFKAAYDNFDIVTVANYGEDDRIRLLSDPSIIRNRLKVNAAIHNAREIRQIQSNYGSFKNWIDSHHPLEIKDWVKLFKKHFKFVGGEIVNEFLMSTGYLPGAHDKNCPIFVKIQALNPKWLSYEINS